MRTFIMALVLVAGSLAMGGCFTFDLEHNRTIWSYWKQDFRTMHEDIDWILAMDELSNPDMSSYYR